MREREKKEKRKKYILRLEQLLNDEKAYNNKYQSLALIASKGFKGVQL